MKGGVVWVSGEVIEGASAFSIWVVVSRGIEVRKREGGGG